MLDGESEHLLPAFLVGVPFVVLIFGEMVEGWRVSERFRAEHGNGE